MRPIGALLAEKNIVLKGADVLSRGGFTQVPNTVLESGAISPGAKLAYAMLLKYAWQNDFCFPGQDRLAKDMGVSLRSTNSYIQELEKKAFINITRRGQGRPNLYELNLTPRSKGMARTPQRGGD
jgi:Helix-turn-helix domain